MAELATGWRKYKDYIRSWLVSRGQRDH